MNIDQLIEGLTGKEFNRVLKREVEKANKRLARMNNFQKGIFEDKGITKISRKGGFDDKLQALAQAKMVNDSGISTKSEYNKYVNQLSQDLSLSKKEVDYMLNSFDSTTRDFISTSTLKYGSNPQVDFLYEDVIQLNENIENKIDDIENYVTNLINLNNEILDITDLF